MSDHLDLAKKVIDDNPKATVGVAELSMAFAAIAQAEALERIATAIESIIEPAWQGTRSLHHAYVRTREIR